MTRKKFIQTLKFYSTLSLLLTSLLFLSISAISSQANTGMTSSLKMTILSQEEKTNHSQEAFSFIAIGDFNEGGCARNDRVNRLVRKIASNEGDAAFYISTGDIIDGYFESGHTASCFSKDPVSSAGASLCGNGILDGNMAEILAPIKDRPPVKGLVSSFYLALGNHDDNWGSNWYPDPCGGGICGFLSPRTPSDFINHDYDANTICSLDKNASTYPNDFYYSFTYRNNYFIVLRQNNDYYGMLSCNGSHTGYDTCEEYCAAEELLNNTTRNNTCYNIQQFDWLRAELSKASKQGFKHIFAFSHAPLITGGDRHPATAGSKQIRALLEKYNVDIHFAGHNHAYERSFALKGSNVDSNGTVYINTGSGGAGLGGMSSSWFNAFDSTKIADYGSSNYADKMTTYLKVIVNGDQVSGQLYSLGIPDTIIDQFSLNP